MSDIRKSLEGILKAVKEAISNVDETEEMDCEKVGDLIKEQGWTWSDLGLDLEDFGVDEADAAKLTTASHVLDYHGESGLWDAIENCNTKAEFAEICVARADVLELVRCLVKENGLKEVIDFVLTVAPKEDREEYEERKGTGEDELKARIIRNLFKE